MGFSGTWFSVVVAITLAAISPAHAYKMKYSCIGAGTYSGSKDLFSVEFEGNDRKKNLWRMEVYVSGHPSSVYDDGNPNNLFLSDGQQIKVHEEFSYGDRVIKRDYSLNLQSGKLTLDDRIIAVCDTDQRLAAKKRFLDGLTSALNLGPVPSAAMQEDSDTDSYRFGSLFFRVIEPSPLLASEPGDSRVIYSHGSSGQPTIVAAGTLVQAGIFKYTPAVKAGMISVIFIDQRSNTVPQGYISTSKLAFDVSGSQRKGR